MSRGAIGAGVRIVADLLRRPEHTAGRARRNLLIQRDRAV
jgi:hypothetical protein